MKLNDFRKTGRFTCREDFEKTYFNVQLHKDCTDVLLYTHDFYIECLSTNMFLVRVYDGLQHEPVLVFKYHKLKEVESVLWKTFADKLINKKNGN